MVKPRLSLSSPTRRSFVPMSSSLPAARCFASMTAQKFSYFSTHVSSLSILFFLALIPCISFAEDTISFAGDIISSSQSLIGSRTLVSQGGTFALGFFQPGNSSSYYIGIWYNKVSQTTPVWVANRDTPVLDRTTSELTISSDGNLVLTSQSKGQIWSTNLTSIASKATVAVLNDTGNLLLRDASNSSNILWQSFDHPTDTFLPGGKLGLNKLTNETQHLISWKNNDDPAPGMFSLEIDPAGTAQYFILWNMSYQYWTSGVWNGQIFSDVPEMTANYIYDFDYISNDKENYFTYSVKDNSIISRFIIHVSGQIQQLTWLENSQQWIMFWAQPKTQCEVYAFCGAFGSCNQNESPYCTCVKGFSQLSPSDWKLGQQSAGCVRNTPLQCGNNRSDKADKDKFYEMDDVQLPDDPQNLVTGSANECELACLNNCSCTAYSYSGNCSLWYGSLLNLQQLVDGSGKTLYLRLAASELADSKGKKKVIIAATVSPTLFILISLLCFVWLRRHRGNGKSFKERSFRLNGGVESKIKRGSESLYHFSQIVDATDNFSNANKLGQGGFGPVYKGQLPEGQEIAVKRLSAHSGQGLEEFKNEIILIAQLQHRNLVGLLGYCIQGEEKILIYEYMPNKSLDYFLFDPTTRAHLDWGSRFHIIEGVAQGLLYLHKHSRLRIIHRDLKASNILLDGDMNPKISDFGLARIFGPDDTQGNTRRVVGTYGYMSPEYALEGLFSVKSDVFSFGVLLLEIVSGKRNAGFHQYGNSLNLLGYVWELWKLDKWLEFVDSSLGDTYPFCELSRCIQVALLCVQESAGDRPTMTDVVAMLSSSSIALPDPKQPAFCTVRIRPEQELSLNEVTFSTVDGR